MNYYCEKCKTFDNITGATLFGVLTVYLCCQCRRDFEELTTGYWRWEECLVISQKLQACKQSRKLDKKCLNTVSTLTKAHISHNEYLMGFAKAWLNGKMEIKNDK